MGDEDMYFGSASASFSAAASGLLLADHGAVGMDAILSVASVDGYGVAPAGRGAVSVPAAMGLLGDAVCGGGQVEGGAGGGGGGGGGGVLRAWEVVLVVEVACLIYQ
jgi:hypothetical protein